MAESDKELADELDAADRLIARGYKRVQCSSCQGFGVMVEGFAGKHRLRNGGEGPVK